MKLLNPAAFALVLQIAVSCLTNVAWADQCGNVVTVERYTVLTPTTLREEQGWLLDDGTYQVITSAVFTYSESFVSRFLPISGRMVCQLLYYNAYKSVGCLVKWVRSDAVYRIGVVDVVFVCIVGVCDPNAAPPQITIQPVSRSAIVGETVAFTVVATGSPAPTYQWRKNGAKLSGKTTSTLTLINVQSSDTGDYTVVASNSGGSVTSAAATLTVSNPFLQAKGVYSGLFAPMIGATHASSGYFSATTTDKGGFSIKLLVGGKSYSMSGAFDASGHAFKVIPRPGLNSLSVELELDLVGDDAITGQISDGVWTAELLANRATFNSQTNPAPRSGKYTLIIPGSDDSSIAPGGDSFGALTVDLSGNVKFKGVLSDGTKVSQKTFLSKDGQWPFYSSAKSGSGSILGWLTFTNEPGDDISGVVSWIKQPQPLAKFYPAGFTNVTGVIGSAYHFTNGVPLLNFSAGEISFTGGNLSDFTNQIGITNNKVTNLSSNKLTLTLTTSSGMFKGKVINSETSKTASFSGAVLQKQSIGSGFFLGTNHSGRVLLRGE